MVVKNCDYSIDIAVHISERREHLQSGYTVELQMEGRGLEVAQHSPI
jgi:hypothetical protein